MYPEEEAIYLYGRTNTMLHMGVITTEMIDKNTGGPTMDVALPLASTLGFYVTANSGPPGRPDQFKDVDPHNEYILNSWGCRDKEYSGPVDIIAAGCSMTFGQGVPVETRWSSRLGSLLDMSVATVAIPGWSTQSAVNAVMSYIKKFGKPKIVALYLPDFSRYDFMASRDNLVPNNNRVDGDRNVPIYVAKGTVPRAEDQPTYSKKPHVVSDVINPETAQFLAGQALTFFIEYCKEAGIKLIYGTWHPAVDEYIKFVSRADRLLRLERAPDFYGVTPEVDLSGYVDMDMFYPKNINSLAGTTEHLEVLECHQDLKSQYGTYFDWGTDRDKHIGVHAHAHVAQKFLSAIKME